MKVYGLYIPSTYTDSTNLEPSKIWAEKTFLNEYFLPLYNFPNPGIIAEYNADIIGFLERYLIYSL